VIRRAKLYARINQSGEFSRIAVPFDRNGRAVPPKLKGGKLVSFAVRVGGKFEHAGEDLTAAVTFLRQRQAQIGTGTNVAVFPPIVVSGQHSGRLTMAEAVANYTAKMKTEVEKGHKSEATMKMYRNAAESLRDHSGVAFMDEITGAVLLNHENWLRKNIVRRTGGHFENTLANRFRYLNVFLRANGIQMSKRANAGPNEPGLLDRKDVPKEKDITDEERAHGVRTYNDDDLKAMLGVATVDEADLIQFALRTGFREGEIAAAEWSDVDWTGKMRRENVNNELIPNIGTGPKAASNWLPKGFRTKNGKFRQVEIPTLIARLKARQGRAKNAGAQTTLIFPNGGGRVSTHLVEIVQDVAERAEKKGHKINGEIGLHRFRKTYGTLMLSSTDIQTVSMLLGHTGKDAIKTTMRYLGVNRAKAATGSKNAFKGLGS
jgi:integrase